jgi:hypothetical protein
MKTDLNHSLLDKLTAGGRMNRRSKKLLRDPQNPEASDWFMYVPVAFNEALDIRFEAGGPNSGWTQSGCFAFKQADTLYDTSAAYQRWADALKALNLGIVVKTASAAGMGEATSRYPGSVSFTVMLPDSDRTVLTEAFEWLLTQDGFVSFLMDGPTGDFEAAPQEAQTQRRS